MASRSVSAPMRILVIRLSAMGDVAMSVPVVGALRKQYPEAQIVVLTPAFLQPFFRGIEALEFVSPDFTGRHKGLKGVLKLSSELGRFDMVADLHDVIRTKMLRRILRLRGAKVAYIDKGREEKKALVALENKKLVQLKTTIERYREVFLALGFDLPPIAVPPRVRYSLDAETEALAGAHEGKKWIGIAPFAQHQGKIYPLEQMERVIAMLSQMPGVRLVRFRRRRRRTRIRRTDGGKVRLRGVGHRPDQTGPRDGAHFPPRPDAEHGLLGDAHGFAGRCAGRVGVGGDASLAGFYGIGQDPQMPLQLDMACRPVRFTATGLAPMATIPVCGALLPNGSSGRCARLRDSLRSPYPNPDAVSTPI